LLIERLAIANAAPKELRPIGHRGKRVLLFREEAPETRVMPAELLTGTVPVLANAPAQLANLLQQLFAERPARSSSITVLPGCPPDAQDRSANSRAATQHWGRRLTA